jgi:RNA polymerase sigma-70 factor (ECF subfamily)
MSSPPFIGLARTAPSSSTQLAPELRAAEDNALLARLLAGEPGSAGDLHRRTRGVVRRTVNRLLGSYDHEAEDLAQVAFIELIGTIANFRGTGPLDAWVMVVSSRVVYRHIRRRRLDRRFVSSVAPEQLRGTSEVTRRELAFRAALGRIRRHLKLVNAKRALTFVLHDVFGYDMQEVANITGVSLAAAKTRLARGRREIHARVHSDPELRTLAHELSNIQDAS